MYKIRYKVQLPGKPIRLILILFILYAIVFSVMAQQKNDGGFAIYGEIKDEQNALITNAEVTLGDEKGEIKKTKSNENGEFLFRDLAKGEFSLFVKAEGFGDYEEKLTLNAAPDSRRISIILYPTVKADVEVSQTDEAPLDAARSNGTIILTGRELENLPEDSDQLSQQLQNLAASGGGIPGEATVTVDGFLSLGRLPSKSSISQVRINPNLYSAEYDTPPFRGGRIEIVTKPGAESFHGTTFFNYNGSAFNARNPFSLERAKTQTRLYGFNFGAPIVKNKAGFFFDFEKRDIDEAQIVNAFTLDENLNPSNFVFNALNPQRLLVGSVRADWQANQNNILIFRYDFNRNKLDGQGIGGVNLPERGVNHQLTENSFRLTETSVLNPKVVNEFRLGLIFHGIQQNAVSNEPAIIVAGSFSSGGANVQELRRNERILEISDYLALDAGRHNLKLGFQIFNRNIGEVRAENTNGTYFFGGGVFRDGANQIVISGLEQYRRTLLGLPGGVPTRYSLTIGVPKVSVNQWLFAGFAQDEWKISQKVSVSLGLRLEGQSAPVDLMSFAPRFGIAYMPDKEQNWVFRARAGVFYNRIAENLSLEAARLNGERQRQFVIDSPTFPNPFLNGNSTAMIPSLRIFDSKMNPPASLQMRLEAERRLPKGWKISVSHSWTNGWSQIRSRNINAPFVSAENPDPLTAPRPFGTAQNILQFESTGRIKGRVLYIGVNQNSHKFFSINAGYLNFDFKTDADSDFALPQSSYDFTGEWSRPSWQTRHLLFVTASFNLPMKLRLFTSFNANSGRPFNITTGRDNNGDGNFNDRPGLTSAGDPQAVSTQFGFLNPQIEGGNLPRNFGTNPGAATLNLNLSRTFNFGGGGNGENRYKLTANIRANNLLNRANFSGVNGILTSTLFGRPTTASPARQINFGLRFNF